MTTNELPILIITGSIGSGKSFVTSEFAKLDSASISADTLAREVVRPGTESFKNIVTSFGEDIVASNGELDRRRLGSLVFEDTKKRKELEKILHPAIREAYFSKVNELRKNEMLQRRLSGTIKTYFIFYDVPLYFESRSKFDYSEVKAVIVSYAPKDICIRRSSERDALTIDDALQRYNSQIDIEKKAELADYIIDNSGTKERTLKQIKDLDRKLRERYYNNG